MTATLNRPRTETANAALRLEPVSRRRPALALGSLALVVVSVAVFVALYAQAGGQRSVLAVARPVSQGAVVEERDLMVVRITATAGVATVPGSALTFVVGRRAAEVLEPGSLLSWSEVVDHSEPPGGDSIVGVAVKDGQLPASGVAPGETVDVVLTGAPGSPVSEASQAGDPDAGAGQPGSVLAPGSTVLDASPSAASGAGTIDVSLLVSSTVAPLVATASAAGQVALVIVDPGT